MAGYYQEHLSGTRLKEVYALASPRIRQYLRAELDHVIELVGGRNRVLELGCGYGRALKAIAPHVGRAMGCDVSLSSLRHAQTFLGEVSNCDLLRMDAGRSAFQENTFDSVVCIQNGISAFGVNRLTLVGEAVRVAKVGGLILFSSYAPGIWEERLDWFREQSRAGLVGPIDDRESRSGTIVCKDGFRSFTVSGEEFSALFAKLGQRSQTIEVDNSSVFGEVIKSS